MYQYHLTSFNLSEVFIKIFSNRFCFSDVFFVNQDMFGKILLFLFFFSYCFFNNFPSYICILVLIQKNTVSLAASYQIQKTFCNLDILFQIFHFFVVFFLNLEYMRCFLSEGFCIPLVVQGPSESLFFILSFSQDKKCHKLYKTSL